MAGGTSAELSGLDATGQAELVRRGDVTASELVEAAIVAMDLINPQINAVIDRRDDRALKEAAAPAEGPFRGVPIVLKDAVCVSAGDRFTWGLQFLKDLEWRPTRDSELASRYRRAGFVIVGRTNVPELTMSPTTEPLSHGPTRNPWNLDRSPGGSSGGSAAAVAAGIVALGHGNDMGGSIRIPASYCGLVGLKPTRGRNPLATHPTALWGHKTCEHVLTRSVRDSAAVLDATAGPTPGDLYSAPPPARRWAEEVDADAGRLRIGVLLEAPAGLQVDPECRRAGEEAAALLESLGHTVESAAPDGLSGVVASGLELTGAYLARDLDRLEEWIGQRIPMESLEPANRAFVQAGRTMSAVQLLEAEEAQEQQARRICSWWEQGWDILLSPTSATVQPLIGDMDPKKPFEEVFHYVARAAAFTVQFNVTGQPAISLPLHWSDAGLPVGVQLVAGIGREDLLFRLAGQLEKARPWAARRPLVHASYRGS